MSRLLPPLNALRAFEAAGRHLSFGEAAAELHVTSGAVSLHIKKLEETLGAKLFERRARSVMLTEVGQRYFRSVRTAFRILKDATAELRTLDQAAVTISSTPLFASQWLMPRLEAFYRRVPGVDVRISTTYRIVDFARDGLDLAIRHGLGRYPGLVSERLVDDDLVVVCRPDLIRGKRLRSVDDLQQFAFLHDERDDHWRLWLRAAGATGIDWPAGPIFPDSCAVIEAAIAGQGIALARRSMVKEELQSGKLANPVPARLKIDLAYHLVYPLGALDRPEVAALHTWLLEQAAAERLQVSQVRPNASRRATGRRVGAQHRG